jgi:hypothetical protein
MTDRELLELAAKAAGIGPLSWIEPDGTKIVTNVRWNPIADDGDALRLAVQLNMGISIPVWKRPRADVVTFRNSLVNAVEEHETDPLAATRRAITRVAAEIGRRIAQQTARADLPEDNYYKTMAEAEETGRTAAEIGRQMP